ncbi:MAG: hypothetical protein WCJ64_17855, partial [Rhodospirillaceae bacterium]
MSAETIRKLALAGAILGFGMAVLAGAMLLFHGGDETSSPAAVGRFVASERPVADFAFTDGAGKPVKLADFAGKVVLLNLWAT